jgi:hypothetical protein
MDLNTMIYLIILLVSAISNQQAKDAPERSDKALNRIEKIMQLPEGDEELNQEVISFLQQQQVANWDDNANVYLWGAAYQTDEPYQLGLELSKKLRTLNLNHDYKEPMDTAFLDELTPLKVLENQQLCSLVETGCFGDWLDILASDSKLLDEYNTHRQRYLRFLEFTDFTDVATLILAESSPFPSYRVLTAGHKLNHLYWLKQLKAGQAAVVLQGVEQESLSLRNRLEQADTLIAKMIFHFMYDHHISFIYSAWSNQWLTREQVLGLSSLQPLTPAQLSTRKAWESEERAGLIMIQHVFVKENAPTILADLFYPGLVDRLIKPNDMLNELYLTVTKPVMAMLDLDARSFYQAEQAFDLELNYDPEVFPAKAMLNHSSEELKSKYLTYPERMFALDMKIQLLRAVVQEGSFEQVLEQASKGHKPYLHHFDQSLPAQKGNVICYQQTTRTRMKDWCLPLIDPVTIDQTSD